MVKKKVVFYLLNCVVFSAFFVYRTLNTNKEVKYNFLHEVEDPGYQKSRIEVTEVLMTFNCQRRKQYQRGLCRTRQVASLGFSEYKILNKLLLEGRGKKRYPARQCKVCAVHKK